LAFYTLTIFLSAFLLFEVQPIIAKMILPWFGGTSAVWSTCMLFFQLVLLFGYLYAHWLNRRFAPRRQAMAHIALLAVSLAALPILPNPAWKTSAVTQPSLRILALLAVTVGLPYFLLASTSPLMQAWYARTHRGGMPYRLFALSNLASMLALLSYPLAIEPNLSSHTQGVGWSAAYVLFAGFCGITAWRASYGPNAAKDSAEDEDNSPAPGWSARLIWLGLAASASVLLLTVTTHMTQDVAAIPFLWILPLSVYLLSFIICFESPRWYYRPVFLPLFAASLGFMAYQLSSSRVYMPIRTSIVLLAASLFVCCMVCHGELVRLKPHPKHLTGFYVTVSLGGALGGIFVGLVAPYVFHAYYEFPVGLALCAVVVFLVWRAELWPGGLTWKRAAVAALLVMLGGYFYYVGSMVWRMVEGYEIVARNFYGQLRVYDYNDEQDADEPVRVFVHGVINHGEQSLRPEYRDQPITYFCPETGIGRVMRLSTGAPRRIGILGLGCGTLAAYGRVNDTLRIYEINPLVVQIAQREFTYLRDTPARVEVAVGDGRLLLESEPDQHFDVLVMDAFSGDSVPVHLITREALQTYFRQLKPGGILAVNVSNRYLDLRPVMERAAAAFGKLAVYYAYEAAPGQSLCFSCAWTLIMDPSTLAAHPELQSHAQVLKAARPFRVWTDDFSNMYSILK
jgi:SAM-dependent methyltransferase